MTHEKNSKITETPDPVKETATQNISSESPVQEPDNQNEIATLAYEYWTERGCPMGTPNEDWFRAEAELNNRKANMKALGVAAA